MTNIAHLIDHTNLKPDAKTSDIEKLCKEAAEWHFASVCVNSCNVPLAARLLEGSGVRVCSVVGFPLGAMSTAAKAFEARYAAKEGASEIDMVMNIGWLKDGRFEQVFSDIKDVVEAVPQCRVKVIIETCLLERAEKIKACELIKNSGAAFAKTSTGFSTGGADVRDVELMREVLGPDFGIKAAGGIRDFKTAMEMINAGATRIGASKSIEICEGAEKSGQQ